MTEKNPLRMQIDTGDGGGLCSVAVEVTMNSARQLVYVEARTLGVTIALTPEQTIELACTLLRVLWRLEAAS